MQKNANFFRRIFLRKYFLKSSVPGQRMKQNFKLLSVFVGLPSSVFDR
jgi:hypothetical protein